MSEIQNLFAATDFFKPAHYQRLLVTKLQQWIEEFETLGAAAAMGSSSTYREEMALEIAKAMLSTYMSGEFQYSARLREIAVVGGQAWLDQKCAKLVAEHIQFDESQIQVITDILKTHGPVHKGQSADYSSDASTSSSSSSSSSPSPASAGIASGSSSSSSRKPFGFSTSSEEITNVRPLNQKPCFRFQPSSLANTLPGFLASMKAANDVLATGESGEHKIELSESDSDQPHIEMNLGLGVLEEIKGENESLSSPVAIKGKGSVTKPATPTQPKFSTKKKDSISSGLDSSPTSESSSSPSSSVKLKLIHHEKDIEPMAEKRNPAKTPKKVKMTHKASRPSKSFTNSISMDKPKKRIMIKLLIKQPPSSELTKVELETDYDWSSVSGYDEDQETERFPAYAEPPPEELEAFSDSIMSVAGSNQLPGYTVVVGGG
ncbi:uncharacterized protein BP5553_03904 [Venustampulla echinocandica]|uniref:Uncharacterized protein n=1 Tax=Venustampulla echinocandica TaxID=2656787 RepID=A0A370TVK6_9HELO|nr:uncharacterized protein BP5553_03904 [Venustampulla echinocandica]RDL39564.1 hypothetical protein BP5553_03904 [Venustampulla echinocandica]